MQQFIKTCSDCLQNNGVLLYPTDTIWGLGCNPFSSIALERIEFIKQRTAGKNYILLVHSIGQLENYVSLNDKILTILSDQTKPTTIIYPACSPSLAHLAASDGSLAFRIVKHPFCEALLKEINIPLISTSANISSEPSPANFADISSTLLTQVDCIVPQQFETNTNGVASKIIKFDADYNMTVIRD